MTEKTGKDGMNVLPGPSSICGYCGRERQESVCGCPAQVASETAQAAAIAGQQAGREVVGHRSSRRPDRGQSR
jgi:hypothetical protein